MLSGPDVRRHVDIYRLTLDDLRNDALAIKPRVYQIRWPVGIDLPLEIRRTLSEPVQAVATNGNGACAIHAVFGRPSVRAELFAPNARRLVATLMRRYLCL